MAQDAGAGPVQVVGNIIVRQSPQPRLLERQSHAMNDIGRAVDEGAVEVEDQTLYVVFGEQGVQCKYLFHDIRHVSRVLQVWLRSRSECGPCSACATTASSGHTVT